MFLFSFFMIIISMFALDGMWLSIMLKRFYIPHIGHLLSNYMSIWPAVVFYVLYGIALNVFVVYPALKNNTGFLEILALGALFGLVTYGTYDLTNQVTLKNWPWVVTITDIAWGGILAATVSVISTYVTRYFW